MIPIYSTNFVRKIGKDALWSFNHSCDHRCMPKSREHKIITQLNTDFRKCSILLPNKSIINASLNFQIILAFTKNQFYDSISQNGMIERDKKNERNVAHFIIYFLFY